MGDFDGGLLINREDYGRETKILSRANPNDWNQEPIRDVNFLQLIVKRKQNLKAIDNLHKPPSLV